VAAVSALQCPFCGSESVERVAQWGGQIITAQWRCQSCASYFEVIRDDFDGEPRDQRAGIRSQHATDERTVPWNT
jgi:transposase-like protein